MWPYWHLWWSLICWSFDVPDLWCRVSLTLRVQQSNKFVYYAISFNMFNLNETICIDKGMNQITWESNYFIKNLIQCCHKLKRVYVLFSFSKTVVQNVAYPHAHFNFSLQLYTIVLFYKQSYLSSIFYKEHVIFTYLCLVTMHMM